MIRQRRRTPTADATASLTNWITSHGASLLSKTTSTLSKTTTSSTSNILITAAATTAIISATAYISYRWLSSNNNNQDSTIIDPSTESTQSTLSSLLNWTFNKRSNQQDQDSNQLSISTSRRLSGERDRRRQQQQSTSTSTSDRTGRSRNQNQTVVAGNGNDSGYVRSPLSRSPVKSGSIGNGVGSSGIPRGARGLVMTISVQNVILWNPSPDPTHPNYAFNESALPYLQQLSQSPRYIIHLIAVVSSDAEESQITNLLSSSGLFDMGLDHRRVIFCESEEGKRHIVRHLEPFTHVDSNDETLVAVAPFVRRCVRVRRMRGGRGSGSGSRSITGGSLVGSPMYTNSMNNNNTSTSIPTSATSPSASTSTLPIPIPIRAPSRNGSGSVGVSGSLGSSSQQPRHGGLVRTSSMASIGSISRGMSPPPQSSSASIQQAVLTDFELNSMNSNQQQQRRKRGSISSNASNSSSSSVGSNPGNRSNGSVSPTRSNHSGVSNSELVEVLVKCGNVQFVDMIGESDLLL
ncbi:hypothetical protein HDU76_013808 [Blyttiomyces sp. JEL0837]|nr:hypothetical protein HDU76_013808 [Blyttiomyces sp. JEL0837]